MDTVKRRLSAGGTRRAASTDATAADADLAKMGYKSELPRSLSMLSVLGLSFAIMAVPFGLSTTMLTGLTDGQSVTILWGWVLVSLISLSIAASLAEICAGTLHSQEERANGGYGLLIITLVYSLPHCGRSLLLVCDDEHSRICPHRLLGNRLAESGWKLDSNS